jgi:hypothetical protein
MFPEQAAGTAVPAAALGGLDPQPDFFFSPISRTAAATAGATEASKTLGMM